MTLVIVDNTVGTATSSGGFAVCDTVYGVIETETLTAAADSFDDLVIHNSLVEDDDVVIATISGITGGGHPVLGPVTTSAGVISIRIYNVSPITAFSGTALVTFLLFKA